MRRQLAELWQYRELLLILVQRDLKVRYKNSVLGFGWSLLNPLVQVLTIAMMLQFMMGTRVQNYHAYVFCAMLPWLFFNTTVLDACPSLLFYERLIRRTYFPREIVPLSVVLANLVHFLLATGVFLLYEIVNPLFWWLVGGSLNWPLLPTVVLLPIPMLGLVLLVTGVSLFVSIWTHQFEDIRFIADSGLRILYWLVPVLYFPDMILRQISGATGELLYTLYMLNPLAAYITAFRKLALVPTRMPGQDFVTPPMTGREWGFLALAFVTSVIVAVLGHRYFNRRKWGLAERG